SSNGRYEGIYEWDLANSKSRRICKDSSIVGVLADHSEQFLFANSRCVQAYILDAKSGDKRWSTRLDFSLAALALSPDERRLAIGDRSGQVYFWNLDLKNPKA